tara:strand:- start:565 stop:837 length:273 start_codon:yes stop_codon:yes gene_type:complete
MSVTNIMPKKTGVTNNSAFWSVNRSVIRRHHVSSNSENFKSVEQPKQLPCKDSSDYVAYRRRVALTRNYNDTSFGGSNNGASQALFRVRR